MSKSSIGFALSGSFCTFHAVLPIIKQLVEEGFDVLPIMSKVSYEENTRFGKAEEFISQIEGICHHSIIHTIPAAEPIGPKKLLDALIIEPCTGNTLGKLANGISDTPITLAAKAHLRNGRPIVIAVSTNDALAGSAENIGKLLATKHYYFVPMGQDDPVQKPTSIVADFSMTVPTLKAALNNQQIQPLLCSK